VNVDQWHIVFGGSWGSALSLVYAETHPQAVKSLILRGVWTARTAELEFSRGTNVSARIFPQNMSGLSTTCHDKIEQTRLRDTTG